MATVGHRLHTAMATTGHHHKLLKFSIDNILSPAFGGPSSGGVSPLQKPQLGSVPFSRPDGATSLAATAKRKHSSDSESSTTSSTLSGAGLGVRPEKVAKTAKSTSSDCLKASKAPLDLSNPLSHVDGKEIVWPAWVYCTRYSDRPSSGEYAIPFAPRYCFARVWLRPVRRA